MKCQENVLVPQDCPLAETAWESLALECTHVVTDDPLKRIRTQFPDCSQEGGNHGHMPRQLGWGKAVGWTQPVAAREPGPWYVSEQEFV